MIRLIVFVSLVVAALPLTGTAVGPTGGTLVCVGDSITAGEGVTAAQCYVGRLRDKAAAAGVALKVVADGRSGWRTGDFARAKDVTAKVPADATTVTILLGTNDTRTADPPEKVGQRAAANVEKLIKLYRAKAPRASFVLVGPPSVDVLKLSERLVKADFGPRTPAAVAAIRAAYQSTARRLGLRFVDLANIPSAGHTIDGVHPDATGHAEIADAVWAGLSAPAPTTRP